MVATKKTTLGLDLKGGTELIFQARPTPQNPTIDGVGHRPRDRDHPQAHRRASASPSRRSRRIGSDSIRVGLPDVSNAASASQQVGQTAQLHFYDWEPNVIPNPATTNVPRSEASFPRSTTRSSSPPSSRPSASRTSARPPGRSYYLFNSQTHACIAGPDRDQKDLFSELPGQKQPPNTPDPHRPAGHARGREGARQGTAARQTTRERTRRRWFVIRDRPGALGHGHHGPEAELRPVQPAERHLQLHRQGPPGVLRRHQDDRRSAASRTRRPGVAGNSQAADQLLRPLRGRPRPADQVAADRQLRRQPRRDRRPHRRRDQRARPSRSPRTSPRSSRSARCRST